jgi:hypothetical protein
MSSILHDRMPLSHPGDAHHKSMGRSKTPPQLSAAFSGHSCNAKEFPTTICPNVGSKIWAVGDF